jgi:hypothetical protein
MAFPSSSVFAVSSSTGSLQMLHFGSRNWWINRRNFGTGRPPENTNRIAQETGAEGHDGGCVKGTPDYTILSPFEGATTTEQLQNM